MARDSDSDGEDVGKRSNAEARQVATAFERLLRAILERPSPALERVRRLWLDRDSPADDSSEAE